MSNCTPKRKGFGRLSAQWRKQVLLGPLAVRVEKIPNSLDQPMSCDSTERRPTWLWMSKVPPCNSVSLLVSGNPNPVPP